MHLHNPIHHHPVAREGAKIWILTFFLWCGEVDDEFALWIRHVGISDDVVAVWDIVLGEALGVGDHEIALLAKFLQ